jgi:hypothetical protein
MNRNNTLGFIGKNYKLNNGVSNYDDWITAPPYVTKTSVQTNAQNLTLPSNITAGEFIVIFVTSSGTVAATPSGYTRTLASVSDPYLGIFTKTADGTEGGTTITVSSSQSPSVCAVLNKGVVDVVGTVGNSGSNSFSVPGITADRSALSFLMIGTTNNTDTTPSIDTNFYPFFDISGGFNDEMYLFINKFRIPSIPSTTVTWLSPLSGVVISIK